MHRFLTQLPTSRYQYQTRASTAPKLSKLVNHYSPVEFVVPTLMKSIALEEFQFIRKRQENDAWSAEDLKREITRLGHWEYYFAFSHGLTTEINATFNDRTKDFHRYRSKLIVETVTDLLGDRLGDTAVLDLASHCGVMALDMGYRGARWVDGVEYRQKNVDQAKFLKDYYRIQNTAFSQGDIFDLPSGKKWDVILCLGILYHVVRPVELLEFCYESCRDFAVVDSICHKQPWAAYVVAVGKNPQVAIEGTRSIELQPTYRAVVATMKEVGFKEIVEVVGKCDASIDLYSDHSRRCLIGFK